MGSEIKIFYYQGPFFQYYYLPSISCLFVCLIKRSVCSLFDCKLCTCDPQVVKIDLHNLLKKLKLSQNQSGTTIFMFSGPRLSLGVEKSFLCYLVIITFFLFVYCMCAINTYTSLKFTINYTFLSISVASGMYQSTIYGLAAKLPFKYSGAVVLGSVNTFSYYIVHRIYLK